MGDRQQPLGVCAVFRDEAPYLREWLAFHVLQGATRFYLYDNDSTDDSLRILRPYYHGGLVQIIHWPGACAQRTAYQHALRAWGREVKWMAFLDVDEFLFCPDLVRVSDRLQDYCGVGAVGACWSVYGSGGVVQRSADLVTQSYWFRSADETLSRHVKSIVRTARAIDRLPADPHHFLVDGGSVDELMRPLEGPLAASPTHEKLRINHYYAKSESEARIKMTRPRADNGLLRADDLLDPSLSAVYDSTILPWLAPLVKALA